MPFDVGFKELDLVALQLNDIFDQVTDRNNAKYFVLLNDRQVANVFVNHDGHAFIECVRECHSKRVWRHDF